MRFLTLPSVTLFLGLSLRAAANSNYAASCNSIQIYHSDRSPPWVFFANCAYPDGTYNVGNAINIDSCFGNSNGNLGAWLNGGFSGSCNNINLSGTILSASCRNDGGGWDDTSIDTNNYIGNQDGEMMCFNQNGL